jgi:hypothetical protein
MTYKLAVMWNYKAQKFIHLRCKSNILLQYYNWHLDNTGQSTSKKKKKKKHVCGLRYSESYP